MTVDPQPSPDSQSTPDGEPAPDSQPTPGTSDTEPVPTEPVPADAAPGTSPTPDGSPTVEPGLARQSVLAALIGAACGLGATLAAALALIWRSAFPFEVAGVTVGLVVALVASVLLTAAAGTQALVWSRRAWGARRASWWVHVLSYVVMLAALAGFLMAAAWFDVSFVGFWLCLGGVVLAGMAQSMGATQYLREDGPPGTLRAHIRRGIERANARADARADAEE